MLPSLPADGRYCTVDPGYQGTLLELVLLTAVEHGWPLSQLPAGALADALAPHGYDRRVTLHCLATYGSPLGGSGDGAAAMDTDAAAAGEGAAGGSGGSSSFALDETAVCLHFARSLLLEQPDWELGVFEEAWASVVPEVRAVVSTQQAHVSGLGGAGMQRSTPLMPPAPHPHITPPHTHPCRAWCRTWTCCGERRCSTAAAPAPRACSSRGASSISRWPACHVTRPRASPRCLPSGSGAPGGGGGQRAGGGRMRERGRASSVGCGWHRTPSHTINKTLLHCRRWEWEDLERYVQDLRGPGQTAEALLLKFTRASQARPTDPVTYSAR